MAQLVQPIGIASLVVLIQFFCGRRHPVLPLTSPVEGERSRDASPYGFSGLFLSVIAIVVIAAGLIVLAVGAVFIAGAIEGGPAGGWAAIAELRRPTTIPVYWRIRELYLVAIESALGLSVLILARWRGGPRWRELVAWRPWSLRRHIVAVLVSLPLNMTVAESLAILLARSTPRHDWHPVPPDLPALALYVSVAVVIGPVVEEILFRGWLYTSLRAKLGAAPCILITAALFSLFHWEQSHLYMLLVLPGGLILGYLRERTGSTRATALQHGLFNLVAVGARLIHW